MDELFSFITHMTMWERVGKRKKSLSKIIHEITKVEGKIMEISYVILKIEMYPSPLCFSTSVPLPVIALRHICRLICDYGQFFREFMFIMQYDNANTLISHILIHLHEEVLGQTQAACTC